MDGSIVILLASFAFYTLVYAVRSLLIGVTMGSRRRK